MPANPPVKRAVRVAERIRSEIMEMLLRGSVRDPRVRDVTLTHATVTDDLQHARLYVRLLGADPPERRRQEVVRAMQGAAGYLRRELGARLQTKYTPDLRFFWDEGLDHAVRVERILEEIRGDAVQGDPAAGSPDIDDAGG